MKTTHVYGLDALRGIAILGVIFYDLMPGRGAGGVFCVYMDKFELDVYKIEIVNQLPTSDFRLCRLYFRLFLPVVKSNVISH